MGAFVSSVRWSYSITSVLEVHVRRVTHMWSWSNIRRHRENLRAYRSAYRSKLLSQGQVSTDTERHVQVGVK